MNCLRCSRESGASFCDECLKTVSLPLPQSPFLNTQIHLNSRKARRVVAVQNQTQKAEETHSHKGFIAAIIILSCLCAVLVCLCLWFGRNEIFHLAD